MSLLAMKTVLVLSFLLCAASAETTVEALKEDPAAPPEAESRVAAGAEEAAAPKSARFNFCPTGWFPYNFRCYKFVNSPMTWFSAEEHCNGLGGHLASATDPRAYSFLQQMTQTAGQSVAWLGGFNLQGRWMWIDRDGFYYTNWYAQSSAYTTYPCVFLRSTNGWGNLQCTTSYRFICSKNPFNC